MAILKAVQKGGVLITDEGDRLVDEYGNAFSYSQRSYILKANGKILVCNSTQANNN